MERERVRILREARFFVNPLGFGGYIVPAKSHRCPESSGANAIVEAGIINQPENWFRKLASVPGSYNEAVLFVLD